MVARVSYFMSVTESSAESKLGCYLKASISEKDKCMPKVLTSIVSG